MAERRRARGTPGAGAGPGGAARDPVGWGNAGLPQDRRLRIGFERPSPSTGSPRPSGAPRSASRPTCTTTRPTSNVLRRRSGRSSRSRCRSGAKSGAPARRYARPVPAIHLRGRARWVPRSDRGRRRPADGRIAAASPRAADRGAPGPRPPCSWPQAASLRRPRKPVPGAAGGRGPRAPGRGDGRSVCDLPSNDLRPARRSAAGGSSRRIPNFVVDGKIDCIYNKGQYNPDDCTARFEEVDPPSPAFVHYIVTPAYGTRARTDEATDYREGPMKYENAITVDTVMNVGFDPLIFSISVSKAGSAAAACSAPPQGSTVASRATTPPTTARTTSSPPCPTRAPRSRAGRAPAPASPRTA